MRPRTLALLVAAAGTVSACDGTTDDGSTSLPPATACAAATATATTSVALAGMQFLPFCVRVAPGAEVTFTNLDWEDHSVTADAGQPEAFESGRLRPGQRFTHRFRATGETVRVHCRFNPEMSGVVIVE